MENDNNIPGIAEPGRQPRWFNTAITLSVLLHVALIAALAPTRFGTAPSPQLDAQRPLVVALRRRNVPEQAPNTAPAAAEAPAPSTGEPATADAMPAETPALPLPRELPSSVVAILPSRGNPATTESDTSTAENPPGTLNAASLASSIARRMENYRSEQQVAWMEECQRVRNRYFTQDCTQDPARRSGSRQVPMALIEPLLDEGSVLGELARERYALAAPKRNFSLIPTTKERLLGPTIKLMDMKGNGLIPDLLRALGLFDTPLPAPDFTRPPPPLASEQQSQQDGDSDTAAFKLVAPVFPGNG